jgi:hypothetical protein
MADKGRKRQPDDIHPKEASRLIMGLPVEEFHEELTPIAFCKTFLNSREKRFIKQLMVDGDITAAHQRSGFKVPVQNVLSRKHIRIAIYRMAPLAADTKISSKMLGPLITERRLLIAMTGAPLTSLKSMESLSESKPKENFHMHSSTHKIQLPERAWAVPSAIEGKTTQALLEEATGSFLPSQEEAEDLESPQLLP